MIPYRPSLILVHDESWQDDTTRGILDRLPGIEVQTIHDRNISSYGKNTLVLMRNPGKFLRSCQGAGAEICCNYFIVSYAWNCHMECTYCILRSYLNNEALVVCTNFDDLLRDVGETLRMNPGRTFRIGTGNSPIRWPWTISRDFQCAWSRSLPLFRTEFWSLRPSPIRFPI